MSNIKLFRVVEPHVDCEGRVRDEVHTVCVAFDGDDGRQVTLAFDGRYNVAARDGRIRQEEYYLYSDCPVMSNDPGNSRMRSGPTREALRVLRDALTRLLEPVGESDPVCDDCKCSYPSDDYDGSGYCPTCAACNE